MPSLNADSSSGALAATTNGDGTHAESGGGGSGAQGEAGGEYINENESEQYDRQIRLWGVDAQKRMSGSRVLFAGIRGVTVEACKNLVLAGVSATLQDDQPARPEDLGANFFLEAADVGKNRAAVCCPRMQELNALVGVTAEERPLAELSDEFLSAFRAVVLCGASPEQRRRVAGVCRAHGKAFYSVETFGYDGFLFCDLGAKHVFRKEVGKALSKPIEMEYPTLQEAEAAMWGDLKDRWGPVPKQYVVAQLILAFHERHGRRPGPVDTEAFGALSAETLGRRGLPAGFLEGGEAEACSLAGAEISPVCAVLGGILGQELIKAISLKGETACNVLVLKGMEGEAKVLRVPRRR